MKTRNARVLWRVDYTRVATVYANSARVNPQLINDLNNLNELHNYNLTVFIMLI